MFGERSLCLHEKNHVSESDLTRGVHLIGDQNLLLLRNAIGVELFESKDSS